MSLTVEMSEEEAVRFAVILATEETLEVAGVCTASEACERLRLSDVTYPYEGFA